MLFSISRGSKRTEGMEFASVYDAAETAGSDTVASFGDGATDAAGAS